MAARRAGVIAERVPAAVPGARSWVAGVLGGWGLPETARDDAVLLAGELLANATRHGGGDAMAVDVAWDGRRVRCAVTDDGGGELPVIGCGGVWATSGRGLVLVEALACAWGAEAMTEGCRVWFDVETGDRS